jgi:Fe-Mn family superoxide dismutase
MKPNSGGAIPGKVEKAIIQSFSSVDKFREEFRRGLNSAHAGAAQAKDESSPLQRTPNAENPLIHGAAPSSSRRQERSIHRLCNRRADYHEGVSRCIHQAWEHVEEMFDAA